MIFDSCKFEGNDDISRDGVEDKEVLKVMVISH